MVRIGRLSWLAVVTALVTSTAYGQEPGKIGITMAYPASVGILWQAGDTIAVRPTITFSGGSSTSTASMSGTTDWALGTTISVLLYMKKYDNVRTYFSPSYRFTHTSTEVTPSTPTQTNVGSIQSTGNSNGASGTFGAEYAAGGRVRIYGEVGFAYLHATNTSSTASVLNSSGNTWGTTAGIGLVFYP